MAELDVLHRGVQSEQARALASAMNRRLKHRSLKCRQVKVYEDDMTLTPQLLEAATACAWALGARRVTLDRMRSEKIVAVGVARMIRNPRPPRQRSDRAAQAPPRQHARSARPTREGRRARTGSEAGTRTARSSSRRSKDRDLPSSCSAAHQWVNTVSMEQCPHSRVTQHPSPSDAGM
jgi:hypothetical protein